MNPAVFGLVVIPVTLAVLWLLWKLFGPKDDDPPGKLWYRKSMR